MDLAYKYLFAFVALATGLLLNVILTSVISGILFYIDREFIDGDIIIKDDHEWIIINISLFNTILYSKELGRWRFIKNEFIRKDLQKDWRKMKISDQEIKRLRKEYNKINRQTLNFE